MINSNPMLQQMVASNPQLAQTLQNPEFLRQLSDPQTLNSLLQLQNAMRQLQSNPLFNSMG